MRLLMPVDRMKKHTEFTAVDVETANADMSSICQVGLATFSGGALVMEWKSFLDPQDFFDPLNVAIHGIDEDTVAGAPTLPEIALTLCDKLSNGIAVCHTHFDRVSIGQAFAKYGVEPPGCAWLDSARVARRTWTDCSSRGYGLHDVCAKIGYEFVPHDALEDAKAAGQILLAAIELTGLSIEDWLIRVRGPIDPSTADPIRRSGNPEGPLYGEVMVFTGALDVPRREAANLASEIGCEVASGVTAKTTMLVVGDQDVTRLAGHDKSTKHRKAEGLIATGQPIRILRETDFKELVTLVQSERIQ
jgi:DNA polymerase-3 subunit epsilon